MTRAALDKILSKTIPKCILLYGESEFLINYYSKIIQAKLACNAQKFYFEEYVQDEVITMLGTNSLFGGKNAVIIKQYNTLSKNQIQAIFSTLGRNPNSYMIIELYKSPNISEQEYAKRFKAFSALFRPTSSCKEIYEVRLYNPLPHEMLQILINRARELSINIQPNLLEYLLSIQQYDISMAYNELEKFVYYPVIDIELINSLSYSLGNVNTESLLDSLFNKKTNLAHILNTLYDEGIDDMELNRELSRYFYILFKLYGHSRAYGSMDCREALGYQAPSHIFATWSKRSLRLTTQKYIAIFDMLNEWRNAKLEGSNRGIQYLIAIQEIL
ncbi:DNA polymerase III subunit delta [Helicobacter muridarum]|uniref:DNA polymerase III subunit delta n=1 Tax=Helicobacter muridarum TaxID=216 RepID=A0A099TWV4_9HELI|nr:DNA polymerase III subunit delta [Helicobacter muridarum]TLD98592.1 DNA polymerase III subunit delta [Helicobacter muridarum]STQ85522.1 DNA polymerase III subunit delta [Helicobacter muridarum]